MATKCTGCQRERERVSLEESNSSSTHASTYNKSRMRGCVGGDGGLNMSSTSLNIYLSFLLIYYKSRLKKQPYVLNLRKINTYYVYIKNAINSQISKNIIRGFRIRFPDGFFTCRYYVNSQVCNWVFLEEGGPNPSRSALNGALYYGVCRFWETSKTLNQRL